MKPVVIFRFSPEEGPGYFTAFLDAQGIPWRLIAIDQGEAVPSGVGEFSGICMMGGPMSVNDPLPWIQKLCVVIRDAFVKDIPLIGHCLGGQLISKALGGRVRQNAVKEIGWSQVFPIPSVEATRWFGADTDTAFTVFQWHGETFSIPMQAQLIASNRYCQHQIVSFGPHLAMQCHVEMTPPMIATWCAHWAQDAAGLPEQPNIQTPDVILNQIDQALPKLRQLADQLYSQWVTNLKH